MGECAINLLQLAGGGIDDAIPRSAGVVAIRHCQRRRRRDDVCGSIRADHCGTMGGTALARLVDGLDLQLSQDATSQRRAARFARSRHACSDA